MKKIAILGLHLGYGGVEQVIINQANMLSDNYEVELVVTYKLNEKPAFKVNDKVKIIYLTDKKPNREEFKNCLKSKKVISTFKEGIKSINILQQKKKTMIKYIENCDADIIISSRVDIAKLLGKYKPNNTITITEEHCHHNNNRKYIKKLKRACKNIDYLVPVSKELTEFYKREIPNIESFYIPNSLNEWTEDKSKLDNKNLISVGRLSPEKGYLDLIDVFQKVYEKDKEFHLDIIGDGVEYQKIKNKIDQLNLKQAVTLWGFKDSKFINEKLKNSSLYLMCSYEESFGIVLLEASAYGVPQIAFSSAQGANEIIENDKTGYLIPNRDKEKMANKIIELINDREKHQKLGQKAKVKAQEFTFENIKIKWLNFVSNILVKKEEVLYKYFDKLYNKSEIDFYKKVEKSLKEEKRMFIVTANPETFTYGKKEEDFNKLLLDGETTLIPDGIGIVKAANILKYNIKERITGVDLANELLKIANNNKYKLAILGATEEVLDKLKEVLKEKYPNIILVKAVNGYTDNKDKFFEEIKDLEPDICLIALGIPNQEKIIYKHLKKYKKGIFVGVGGSLDVISGTKKRAPKFFQKLNLEWLYRILKEPKRLKRFYENNIKFIIKIKKMQKAKSEHNQKYYCLLFLFYFLIAIINQYYVFKFDFNSYFNFQLLYFCFFWTFLFLVIRTIIPPKIGKYLTMIFQILLLTITIANYFYMGYFHTIFSWRDLILSGEGITFISSIIPLIRIKIVIALIIFIIMIIFTTKFSPKKSLKILNHKMKALIVIFISIVLTIGYLNIDFSLKDNNDRFNDNRTSLVLQNKKITYTDWNDGQSALKICGIYQYLFRDFYLTFFSNDNPVAARKYLDKFLSDNKKTENKNEYSNLFKNKNLILVMMESADDWQINEKSTPTIYKMKTEGIDFINHYSPNYVTGKTAQSEFMANTGIYPKFNSILPHYGYVNNNYKYSLPNLFKEKGYTVNAFHRTVGAVYNREKMMKSLGYENYYTIYAMQLTEEEYDLDRYFAIKGFNAMTKKIDNKPFMSFYITFSNHSPYTLSKKECSLHYEEIKKLFPEETNDEKLCGYAQMKETDLFFELLLSKLKEERLLQDTVIIAFSDHSNGMFMNENETDKLNKTEMFIYNPEIKPQKITNLSSTINILPMVNNLFGLESPYFMASYDPLANNESYILFNDYTYYNGNEILPIKEEYMKNVTISKNILIADYYN